MRLRNRTTRIMRGEAYSKKANGYDMVNLTLMLQKLQKFGWQGGPKTGAAIVLEYVSEPVAGPTQPRRACAI